MKKFIYISGIACTNIFLLGSLMKMLHWPGASIMVTLGLGIAALVFLPLALNVAYKEASDKALLWVYLTGFLCAFIDLIGAMFKINHYPGANILLMIGIPIPFILFLPVYVYNHIKRKDQQMSGLLGVMFLMTYIAVFSVLLAVRP
ncbi:MAG: hypothetical protein AB9842_07495 [Bacteroidales bacterium]